MTASPIDSTWHPLAGGCPPDWASGWGQDRYGVFVEFTVRDVTQRLRWIPPGRCGSWYDGARSVRATYRNYVGPVVGDNDLGFRCARA